MVLALAVLYTHFGSHPRGCADVRIKPVIIAIVAQAVTVMPKAFKVRGCGDGIGVILLYFSD